MLSTSASLALIGFTAVATALPAVKRDLQPYSANVTIHESCDANSTQRQMLDQGLADAMTMSKFALDYVVTNGAEDPLYLKWFGTGDYISVVGAYQSLLYSNKRNVTFRCDDIDGNCHQDGWAGHWRGSNATSETVICPLSYQVRLPIDQVCQNNFTVAASSLNTYWATDLIHRLLHIPAVADDEVGHVADSYTESLELAQHNASWTPFNSHTVQYFALEAYANEVAMPGQGCTGEPVEEDHDHDHGTATSSAPTACHTHADGVEHCE